MGAIFRPRGLALGPAMVPTEPVEIDWTHPLAQGLIGLFIPAQGLANLVGDGVVLRPYTAGAGGIVATAGGPAWAHTASGSGLFATATPAFKDASSGQSVFWRGSVLGSYAGPYNAPIAGIGYADTDTAPYVSFAVADESSGVFVVLDNVTSTPTPLPAAGSQLSLGVAGGTSFGSHLYINGQYNTYASAAWPPNYSSTSQISIGGYYPDPSRIPNLATEVAAFYQSSGGDSTANSSYLLEWLTAEPFAMLRPIVRRRYYRVSAPSGNTTASSSATAAGTGAASGTPASTVLDIGIAAGTGAASGTSASQVSTTGSAAGTGAASGSGTAATPGSSSGTATGTGAAAGSGATTDTTTGAASGTGAATATPAALAKAIGASAGIAAAIASVSTIISSAAAAAGVGSATGAGSSSITSIQAVTGSAAGRGASLATAASIAAAIGASAGIAATLGRASTIARSSGQSAGTGAATSVGYSIMTVPASEILTRVRAQLVDDGAVQRWSDTELLLWLSDAQRALVAIEASAGSVVSNVNLAPGTRQSIPPNGYAFLNIYRNMTSAGGPGRAVRVSRRELLDTFNPDWHTAPASSIVVNYCYDPEDPRAFYVYPPNDGTGYVEINYSGLPAEITTTDQTIGVHGIYQTPLFYYVMAIAHMKDSDSAAGPQMAQFYMQQFVNYITTNDNDLTREGPNAKLTGFNPGMKGANQ